MVWANPTPVVTRFRQHLMDLEDIFGVDGTLPLPEASVHYPSLSFTGLDPDALPAILIVEPQQTRQRWAEGVIGLPAGTVSALLYVPWSVARGVGFMESLARSIQLALSGQFEGLPFQRISTTMSSEPTQAARAGGQDDTDIADDSRDQSVTYATIAVTCEYGLTRGR